MTGSTTNGSVLGSMARLSRDAMRAASAGFQAWSTASVDLTSALLADPTALRRLPVSPAQWLGRVTDRNEPTWSTEHRILFETPLARLRDYSTDSDSDVVPTLVLPPQAGHSSSVVDFSAKQSQMATIVAAGLTRAYTLDYKPATQQTKDTSVEDYMALIRRTVAEIGGPVNLVGDCQGGWLAAIYAALHPEDVHTLTLAGAPIDFHAGDASMVAYTRLMTGTMGLAPYRAMVAAGGGNMPGSAVLNGFIALRPEAEIAKQLQLFVHLDDAEHLRRYAEFEDWFKYTQSVPGTFYLWLVEHLFKDNELIEGRLVVDGRRVDLGAIECPLYLLAGEDDHITPPPQLFAAADAVGTPAEDITKRTTNGGHLGLFMGREALREHWAPIMADIRTRSDKYTDPVADAVSARARTVRGRGEPPVPAP